MANEDLLANFSDQTIRGLAALQVELARNPKTRIGHLMNVKSVDPAYNLPSDVQMAQFEHRLNQKDAKREHDARVASVSARMAAARAGLLDGTTFPGHRFTEEDAVQIEKLMEANGIVDHATGAKLYLFDLKPEKPEHPGAPSAGWEFPSYDGLMEAQNQAALNKAALNQAYAVVDELRGRVR
jgi:hypothetical protein